MRYYAGLDVSMQDTTIAIVNESGDLFRQMVSKTDPAAIAKALNSTGVQLEKAGIESASMAFWLIHGLQKLSVPAICIDSRTMSRLIELKINKTDKNDARSIANAIRGNHYREVHLKDQKSIEMTMHMNIRRQLVCTRTKLKNGVRGFIKSEGIRLGAVSHDKFSATVRQAIETSSSTVQVAIEPLLNTYETVSQNIAAMDQATEALGAQNPIVALLMSVPGVGLITALTFIATIDDPHRFKKARNVGAYLGLTPGQYSSGQTTQMKGISKCGSSELRSLLIECGMSILTKSVVWTKLKAWGLKILRKHGARKAACAVARKLAVILLKIWQTNTPFNFGTQEEQAKAEQERLSELAREEASQKKKSKTQSKKAKPKQEIRKGQQAPALTPSNQRATMEVLQT